MNALPERGTYRSFTASELDRLDVSTDMMKGLMFDVLRCAWLLWPNTLAAAQAAYHSRDLGPWA